MEQPPSVRIVEQPAEKNFRFRYESENRLGGSIFGENSTRCTPSYPKIEIRNFIGTVAIIISCVTNEKNSSYHRQHPHKLSSKNKISEGGYYKLKKEIRGTEIIEFKDLGIVFVKREHMRASLEDRKLKKVDPTRGGWDHINKKQHIDLHSVRLCFQVCMETPNEKYKQLACVISNKILDKKSHGSLNIDETSLTKAKVSGGKRFFIFCSRVKRDDISILLYEKDKRNTERRVWEKEINFRNSPTMRVHHQYAISFVMPPYKDTDISEPCKAYFQLYRPSDEEYSDPIQFEFMPVKMKHLIEKANSKGREMTEAFEKVRRKRREMSGSILASLNSLDNHPNKKDKLCTSEFVPNIPGPDNRMINLAEQIMNDQPLIDISTPDQKENCQPFFNQNHQNQNMYQASTSHQNNYIPSNAAHLNEFYYSTYTQQYQYGNCYNELNNMDQKPSHLPPNNHHQQHLPMVNNYTNGCIPNGCAPNGYGAHQMNSVQNQTINPIVNCMPMPIHDYNIQPNRQHNQFTENARPTDTQFEMDTNFPNFSDLMAHTCNTSEIINNMDKITESMESVSIDKN